MRADPDRAMKAIALICAAPLWGAVVVWLSILSVSEARFRAKAVDVPSSSASIWDARARGWSSAPPLVTGRTRAAGALLADGAVLIAGGDARTAGAVDLVRSRTSEIWHPTSPSTCTGPLPEDATEATALALPDGRAILISCGSSPLVASRGASLWRLGAPYLRLPGLPASFASAMLPDGKVLLVSPGRGDAETWDPSTDVWRQIAAPPLYVSAPALVPLADGRMLLVGGPDGETSATQFQVWAPGAANWQTSTSWPGRALFHHAAQLSGGEVLVLRRQISGWAGATEDAASWDPSTGQITSIDPPSASVDSGSTLTPLADGMALHVGTPVPELWSAREQHWTTLAPPGSPVRGHVAVRLDEGRVLIAGGDVEVERHFDAERTVLASAGGLGALLLVMGAFLAIRSLRPSVPVLVLATLLAGTAGVALYVFLSVSRGGG